MLEIDYGLVSMSEEDEAWVRQEVLRKIEQGELPPPDRTVDGRVVVVNPDLVQTEHQISDDLRPRLRRIMLAPQEGSTHLSGDRLYQAISESDERLYLIIIELHSEFRHFTNFLDWLPRLRMEYPEMAVFLSGSMKHLREKIHQILSDGDITLSVEFGQERPNTEISDPQEFLERVSTQEQVVSLSIPFFTEIRLMIEQGGKPIPFNLLSLKKLHSVLGHGDAREVEIGKGRKEREIIINLPVQLIHDFRFRQDRGLEFLGVVINGEKIHSRYFGEEKLEFRWVPMKSVESFIRRNPAGEEERVVMKQVSVLRVNTLTGQVSFVMKEESEQVALDQARALGFRKRIKGKAALPVTSPGQEHEPESLIRFDRFIQPGPAAGGETLMQEAVKAHFYRKLIGEEVEQARKLEIYAQRLKVGAVGPLAGQTLKLLRRFGLERLIHPESFYYLCDSPEELLHFRNLDERYEQHFQGLVHLIGDLALGKPSENIRLADIAFNLPISTEWVDTGLASFEKVSTQELEAVFHEMHLLLNFITHEFRRNFDINAEDVEFFSKIQSCREAALLAKWLSEFKREAYGKIMPDDEQPDMLFFPTQEDKKENDTRYFFPSMSCMELFREPANKELFQEMDYDFSVFLEEQLALAIHHAREEGALEPEPEHFTAYFMEKSGELKKELNDLSTMLDGIDNADSDVYQRMLKIEESTFHQRFEKFKEDREKAGKELVVISKRLDGLIEKLKPHLGRAGITAVEQYYQDDQQPEVREQRILDSAEDAEKQYVEGVGIRFGRLTKVIEGWVRNLEGVGTALAEINRISIAQREIQDQRQMEKLIPQWEERKAERLEVLQRMNPMERDHHTKRVEVQERNLKGETEQAEKRVAQFNQKHQSAVAALAHYVAHASKKLEQLGELDPTGEPRQVVRQAELLRRTLGEISRNALRLAARSHKIQENLNKMRLRRHRDMEEYHHFQMELALLQAVAANAPEPVNPFADPSSQRPGPGDPEALKTEWVAQRNRLSGLGQEVKEAARSVEAALQEVKGTAATLVRFKTLREHLIKTTARKRRVRDSANALADRQSLMDQELADLPQRIKNMYMPARKKLLLEVFVPEQERRVGNIDKVQVFMTDLIGLSYERLKERYLDHAIQRRFYSLQFLRGGGYAGDPASPQHHTMRNVGPGLKFLQRAIVHNFKNHNLPGMERVSLPQLTYHNPQDILATLENMAGVDGPLQFDYLVLPPTLSLTEGLTIINKKDELFHGVPRLVLIYAGKFDRRLIRDDPAIREAYFKAVKHNIVVNIDGYILVDNPRHIGLRLLGETLGCAIDVPAVEEPRTMGAAGGAGE